MPSTPSSTDPAEPERFSRRRLALLVALSVLIPAVVLAVILVHDHHDSDASAGANGSTPVTDVAPVDHSKARVGRVAPDFELTGVDGKVTRLSSLRGRPVVLTFFASWCHPCEEELPVLEKLQRESGHRVAVVGVNYQESASDTRDFVRRLGVTFPALVEDERTMPVAERYGVHGIPVTFFLDTRGVVATEPVFGSGSRAALQPGLDRILGR